MKLFGSILTTAGVFLGLVAHPLFYVVATIGFLLFMQGTQTAIIAYTTEYVRRAITENKSYEELQTERYQADDDKEETEN